MVVLFSFVVVPVPDDIVDGVDMELDPPTTPLLVELVAEFTASFRMFSDNESTCGFFEK